MSDYAVNELDRRLANLIRIGTISDVDTDTKLATVVIGDITTDGLPWLVRRAGSTSKTWWAPEVGEQVVVLSPGGELNQGVITGSIFQSDTSGFEANGDEQDIDRMAVGDALVEISNDSVNIKSKAGGVVNVGNSPPAFASRADRVDARLDALEAAYNGHVHSFVDTTPLGTITSSTSPTLSTANGTSTAADEVKIK